MFNLCKFSVKSKTVANMVGVCIDFHHGSSVNLTCSIMPSYYLAELITGYLLKGAVSRQSSSLCLNFANYSLLIAMELKVSKGITCKWQNQRSETNKYVSWALFLKLQTAEINFENLLGWIVFKNSNFNPFQSTSVLPIRGICCFCYVILTFL